MASHTFWMTFGVLWVLWALLLMVADRKHWRWYLRSVILGGVVLVSALVMRMIGVK